VSLIDEVSAWIHKKGNQHLRVATGELVLGVDYDKITQSHPDEVTDVFTYTLEAATIQTITAIYTNSCKDDLLTVDVI